MHTTTSPPITIKIRATIRGAKCINWGNAVMVIDVFRYTHFHLNRNSGFSTRIYKVENTSAEERESEWKSKIILARGRLQIAFGEMHSKPMNEPNERPMKELLNERVWAKCHAMDHVLHKAKWFKLHDECTFRHHMKMKNNVPTCTWQGARVRCSSQA